MYLKGADFVLAGLVAAFVSVFWRVSGDLGESIACLVREGDFLFCRIAQWPFLSGVLHDGLAVCILAAAIAIVSFPPWPARRRRELAKRRREIAERRREIAKLQAKQLPPSRFRALRIPADGSSMELVTVGTTTDIPCGCMPDFRAWWTNEEARSHSRAFRLHGRAFLYDFCDSAEDEYDEWYDVWYSSHHSAGPLATLEVDGQELPAWLKDERGYGDVFVVRPRDGEPGVYRDMPDGFFVAMCDDEGEENYEVDEVDNRSDMSADSDETLKPYS